MSERRLDPKVAELLAAVARRGGSRLFRVTAQERRRQPLEQVRVGPARAGLKLAERELVSVHRTELARLLHEAFWLAVDEAWKERSVQLFYSLPTLRDWRLRGASALEELPVHPTLETGLALLGRCIGERDPAALDHPGDLLIVALRLEDTLNARNDLALDRIHANQPETAASLLLNVLKRAPSERDEWLAWLNLGYAHACDGAYSLASHAYERATRVRCARLSTWMYAFTSSLLAGDETSAKRMANELDQRADATDSEVSWLLAQVRSNPLQPGELRSARTCFERITAQLGPIARDVGHAL